MTTMFVRHTVADYKAWRKVYDEFRTVQKANGVTAEAVYHALDNPNDIMVTHEFGSLDAAKAFLDSEDLKTAMKSAGVVGAPTIWFADQV